MLITAPTALIGADALKSGTTSDSLPSDEIGDSCSSQGLSETINQNASSEVGGCCPCTNFDITHQPTKLEQSKVKGHQLYSRSIQPTWYTKYQWISVCISSYKVFCNICCSARKRGLVKFSKRYNLAFVEEGFSNWKKALQRFAEHEKSEMHRESLAKLSSIKRAVDVGVQLSSQRETEMKNHRAMFMKLLDCVLFWLGKDFHFVVTTRTAQHLREISISYYSSRQKTMLHLVPG